LDGWNVDLEKKLLAPAPVHHIIPNDPSHYSCCTLLNEQNKFQQDKSQPLFFMPGAAKCEGSMESHHHSFF
jgi:hypothetical protein